MIKINDTEIEIVSACAILAAGIFGIIEHLFAPKPMYSNQFAGVLGILLTALGLIVLFVIFTEDKKNV